jgi:hypothetical protein
MNCEHLLCPSSTCCGISPSCLCTLLALIQSAPTYQTGLYAILYNYLFQRAPDNANPEEWTECLSLSMARLSGMHAMITDWLLPMWVHELEPRPSTWMPNYFPLLKGPSSSGFYAVETWIWSVKAQIYGNISMLLSPRQLSMIFSPFSEI